MQVEAFPDEKVQVDEAILTEKNKPSIIGGSNAGLNKFPFFALFNKFGDYYYDDATYGHFTIDYHMCGGSLIAPDIILTAAHCVDHAVENIISKVDINPYELKAPHVGHVSVSVEKIVMNPNYYYDETSGYSYYDTAIVKLSEAVTHVPVLRINKPTDPPLASGTPVVAIGYGITSDDYYDSEAYILQKLTLSLVPYEECKPMFTSIKGMENFPQDVTCAQKVGSDVCYGDSGGPLLVERNGKWIGLGAVSGGIDCSGDYPSWYSDFTVNYEWIRTNTCIYADSKEGLQFDCSDINLAYTCTDKAHWVDSSGDACAWYGEQDFKSYEYYDDVNYAEYFKTHSRCAVYGDCCRNKYTASEACCACGGGDVELLSQPLPPPPPITTKCTNISDWVDSDGKGCVWYAGIVGFDDEHYYDDEKGEDRCSVLGNRYKNNGHTAVTACCICGGGSTYNHCKDVTINNDQPWVDSDGEGCDVYASRVLGVDDQYYDDGDTYCSYHGSDYTNNGFVAETACCVCGGGIR